MDTEGGEWGPLRFPGQEAEQFNLGMNGATERSYNIFRWYRPGWGRYTQSDPLDIVPMAAAEGFMHTSDSNLFAYALDNPARHTDAFGLYVDLVACPLLRRRLLGAFPS